MLVTFRSVTTDRSVAAAAKAAATVVEVVKAVKVPRMVVEGVAMAVATAAEVAPHMKSRTTSLRTRTANLYHYTPA